MKYFAALLMMKDLDKNVSFRQQHIDFLTKNEKEGKIFITKDSGLFEASK